MRRSPTLIATALLVALPLLAVPEAPVVAQEATRIPLAEFQPLPAAGDVQVSAAAREARAALLGPLHDDPDHVTLHWTGVSSFVLTVGGHLVLLDAWEIVGVQADVLPLGREELAALDPEAILVGHGHFDHAADVGYVAGRTGAVVVGSEEICDVAEDDAARDGNAVVCAITGTATTPAPGTAQELQLFADLDPVVVLQHIHSASSPPGEDNPPGPLLPIFDPTPYLENPNLSPEELARFVETLGDPQGGTWMYHFTVGDFTLLWGNSSGPIFQDDAAPVVEALGSFPGCVDVLSNAILGFNQLVSGLQDPRLYVDAIRPKLYLPQHGDAWVPVVSAGQAQYIPLWREENEALGIHQPATRFLLDPDDYLRQVAFDSTDPIWQDERPGTTCATDRIDRRWGPDRAGTAAELSQTRYAPGGEEVWLVPGGSFAEALIAAPAAALTRSPVVLFDGDRVPDATLAELARLRPERVVALNGRDLVPDLLEAEGVTAVEGVQQSDPYLLAATISELFFPDAQVAYLTTGEDFPDALAAGPAAIAEGAPVLLTPPDRLHPRIEEELRRLAARSDDLRVVIVGGESAVGPAVATALAEAGIPFDRVAGPDRTATAAAVAALPLFDDARTVFLATGEAFPDALTVGAPAGLDGAPVLLLRRDDVPEATASALRSRPPVALAVVAGGDAVVAASTRRAVDALLP
jgi:hypothetical protein